MYIFTGVSADFIKLTWSPAGMMAGNKQLPPRGFLLRVETEK
jgi:hypothetical protein